MKIQRLTIALLLCLFSIAHPQIDVNSPNISANIKKIQQAFLQKNYQQFRSGLDSLVQRFPGQPAVKLLQALDYLRQGGLENRLKAYELLERYRYACRRDPFTYFVAGLIYLARQNEFQAKREFKKAVELDTTFVNAYVRLGEIYLHSMLDYYYRYTDTEIPLSYREFAIDDFDQAVSYLKRALQIDPSNREAKYLLGNLYYEVGDYDQMIELFRQALAADSLDTKFNMFLGLAYLANRQYSEAARCFRRVIPRLKGKERRVFTRPLFLKELKGDSLSAEESDRYWRQNDPLFLTPENERLLEHYGRVAYANLRFSVPRLGIEGWNTDRGRTYIRYGPPQFIMEYGKSIEGGAVYPPTQIWFYKDFFLYFSDEFWNGEYRFTQPPLSLKSRFRERTLIDFTLVAQNLFRTIPQRFEFELSGGTFQVPYRFTFFRQKNQLEGLLVFELPRMSEYSREEFSLGLFRLSRLRIPETSWKEELQLSPSTSPVNRLDSSLVAFLTFNTDSGRFRYSLEIIDEQEERCFVSRDSLQPPGLLTDRLTISDLLLAYDIQSASIPHFFHRHHLSILPSATHLFAKNQPLYLYFEIYNIPVTRPGERVNLRVENTLTALQKRNFLWRLLGKRQREISIVNEYVATAPQDFIVQTLNLSNLSPGRYQLEIAVTEEKNGQTSVRRVEFQIVDFIND